MTSPIPKFRVGQWLAVNGSFPGYEDHRFHACKVTGYADDGKVLCEFNGYGSVPIPEDMLVPTKTISKSVAWPPDGSDGREQAKKDLLLWLEYREPDYDEARITWTDGRFEHDYQAMWPTLTMTYCVPDEEEPENEHDEAE